MKNGLAIALGIITLLGVGVTIGAVIVLLLMFFGGRPTHVGVGPVEFEIPTAMASQSQAPSNAPTYPTSAPGGLHICGEPAFSGGLQTSDPLFSRPEGYFSGWISSDPATVILSDGTTKTFATQFVLVVDNLPSVQVKGVMRQAGKANTWGCWYSANLSTFATDDAKQDFCIKKANGFNAVFDIANTTGFQEIGTTATISCP
ncbi:MAG: hypothetical protein WA821_10680 [Anaerolineales bacterium]